MLWQALALLFVAWAGLLLTLLAYGGRFSTTSGIGGALWPANLVGQIRAERRARELLREMLTPEQNAQLRRLGYLEVLSPSNPQRVYRVPGGGGLVRVFEQGKPIMDLCLQPVDVLPDGDVVTMHKLMIEGNEEEYLAKANHFAPGILALRGYR